MRPAYHCGADSRDTDASTIPRSWWPLGSGQVRSLLMLGGANPDDAFPWSEGDETRDQAK